MIRITAELIPHGDESKPKKVLGVLEIANDGNGKLDVGNYTGILHAEYTKPGGRHGRVEQFHRQTQSVWSLVGAFLKLFGHTKHSPQLLREDVRY